MLSSKVLESHDTTQNPFNIVNLTNKVKKCAGYPYPFQDIMGPPFLGLVIQHKEKYIYLDANGNSHISQEANRYYHCQWEYLRSRHAYINKTMIRIDVAFILDDFQQ